MNLWRRESDFKLAQNGSFTHEHHVEPQNGFKFATNGVVSRPCAAANRSSVSVLLHGLVLRADRLLEISPQEPIGRRAEMFDSRAELLGWTAELAQC